MLLEGALEVARGRAVRGLARRQVYVAICLLGPRWCFQNGMPVFGVRGQAAPDELAIKARDCIRDNNVPLEELVELDLHDVCDDNGAPKNR